MAAHHGSQPPLPSEASESVYENSGNPAVLDLLDPQARVVLDVGCGAGDNAELLQSRASGRTIYGITASSSEAALARRYMKCCWVADLEQGLPDPARAIEYDALLFSHVLEHLRDPAELVRQAAAYLRPGGTCAIAVPNVMVWRQRAKFLCGHFEYESTGIMDSTHLRFYTWESAARSLLAKAPSLRVVEQRVTGSVPLWFLRRHVLPKGIAGRMDRLGCRLAPNLFGSEVLIGAVKDT